MVVSGDCWLFSGILPAFVRLGPAEDADIYGVSLASFGESRWFDASGQPSAIGVLNQAPSVVLDRVRRRECLLLLDMSNEGQPFLPEWLEVLHRGLDQLGLPPGCCAYLQQNRQYETAYLEWASGRGVRPIHIRVHDHFIAHLSRTFEAKPLPSGSTPSRHYLSLNFTPRPLRTSLVAWLVATGLEARGYISLGGFAHPKMPYTDPRLLEQFPYRSLAEEGLRLLRERAPFRLDLETDQAAGVEMSPGPSAYYDDSIFSLVAETDVSAGDVVRITEKVIKPLAAGHPVLLLGNPGSLALLRNLGFQTFEGFADERYDLIKDPTARIKNVLDQVTSLCALTVDELRIRRERIGPVLEFNAVHAQRLLKEQYQHNWIPSLFNSFYAE